MQEHLMSQPFDLPLTPRGGRLFGLIMLILGATAVFFGIWHFLGRFELPPEFSTIPFGPLCGLFGFMFFIVGLRGLLRYRGYRVDPARQTFREIRKGLLGTRYGDELTFNDVRYVGVVRERQGSREQQRLYYRVYIHLNNNESLRVFSSDRYSGARVSGEKLARLADVELHDSSAGVTQIRKPAELDQTVREQLRLMDTRRPQPSQPSGMRALIQPGPDRLTIEIPRFGAGRLGPMQKVLWIVLALFAVWIAVALFFASYLVALVGAVFLGTFLGGLMYSETITLTRDSFSVNSGFLFFRRTRRIPLSELEELCLLNVTESESRESNQLLDKGEIPASIHSVLEAIVALGSSVLARSDRESVTFGRILSQPELDYVLYELESRIID